MLQGLGREDFKNRGLICQSTRVLIDLICLKLGDSLLYIFTAKHSLSKVYTIILKVRTNDYGESCLKLGFQDLFNNIATV